jgi:pimeloyl-ACP methyl ester carboxylesterase
MINRYGSALTLALLMSSPVHAADLSETSVMLGQLAGSYVTPSPKPAMAALILAGSGPTDRNGNGPTIHTDAYKMLADGLATYGIATLRTDKRGIAESAGAMTAESDLRIETYSDDAKAWAADLKSRTGLGCVWLIGHSEGAMIAELAAADNSDVCGLVLLEGAGRKAGDVLREQLAGLPDPLKQQAYTGIAELEAGRTIASPPPQLMGLLRPSVQPYMISWLAIDPAALLASEKKPVLIVQGDTDLQVAVGDAKRLAAARPDAKLVILPGVNHILKKAPADRTANLATYVDPTLPLAEGVVDNIVQFMQGHHS